MPQVPDELLTELLTRLSHDDKIKLVERFSGRKYAVTVHGELSYTDLPTDAQAEVWEHVENVVATAPTVSELDFCEAIGLESLDVRYRVTRTISVRANSRRGAIDTALDLAAAKHNMTDLVCEPPNPIDDDNERAEALAALFGLDVEVAKSVCKEQ